MIYLTMPDLLRVITADVLDDVLDDDTLTSDEILDDGELSAIGEMNGYLNIRYDISRCYNRDLVAPDPPTHTGYSGIPTTIQMLADIVLYHVHSRVMPDNVPKLRQTRYDNAINWLEKVSSGYIAPELPIKDVNPTNPLRYGNSSTTENRYF